MGMISSSSSLNQTHRLHRLVVSGYGETLLPEAFVLNQGINQVGELRILAYSNFMLGQEALSDLLNASVCLQTQLGFGGNWRSRSGYIQSIYHLYSDGALHHYEVSIVSALSFLKHGIHTRVFHNLSGLDIISQILDDYAPELVYKIMPHTDVHEPATRILASRTQAGITDYEFVLSLLHDAGLSCVLLEPTEQTLVTELDQVGRQMLYVFSDSSQLPKSAQSEYLGGIAYATSTLQNQLDSIMQITSGHQVQGSPAIRVVADSNGKACIYQGVAQDEALARIYTRSRLTPPTTTYVANPSRITSDDEAQTIAKQLIAAQTVQQNLTHATGNVRDIQAGQQLTITGYLDQDNTYLCTAQIEAGLEPKASSHHTQNRRFSLDWLDNQLKQAKQATVANWCINHIDTHGFIQWMSLLPTTISYATLPSRFCLPSLYQASADYQGIHLGISQGSTNHESQVTDDGQVTLKPAWQGHSKHDAGYHLPTRVLQAQHGTSNATHGWQFLPRQNQSLGYQHLYNDPDSPIITAQFYDGIGVGDADSLALTRQSQNPSDNQNLMGGNSPRWHGAGQDSSVYEQDNHQGYVTGTSQYSLDKAYQSHVLMDDTPNQLGLEIQHQKVTTSQPQQTDYIYQTPEHRLDLGSLTHRKDNHRSKPRGTGFDAATNHSSHIQASQGLLITSYKIKHNESTHEPAYTNLAGQQLLKFSQDISKTLSDANRQQLQPNHGIDNPLNQLQQQAHDSTGKDYPKTGKPHVLIHSRDNLYSSSTNHLLTSEQQLTQSGGNQHWISGQDIQLHSDSQHHVSGLSAQSGKDGMRLSANQQSLSIQAQGNILNLDAKGNLQIASQDGEINLASPKQIKLATQGGAAILINDQGITLTCPGKFEVKTSKRSHTLGERTNYSLPAMPVSKPIYSNKLDVYDLFVHNDFSEVEYTAILDDGQIMNGKLDEHGRTGRLQSLKQQKAQVLVGLMEKASWNKEIIYKDENQNKECKFKDSETNDAFHDADFESEE